MKIQTLSLNKTRLKMLSANSQWSCLALNIKKDVPAPNFLQDWLMVIVSAHSVTITCVLLQQYVLAIDYLDKYSLHEEITDALGNDALELRLFCTNPSWQHWRYKQIQLRLLWWSHGLWWRKGEFHATCGILWESGLDDIRATNMYLYNGYRNTFHIILFDLVTYPCFRYLLAAHLSWNSPCGQMARQTLVLSFYTFYHSSTLDSHNLLKCTIKQNRIMGSVTIWPKLSKYIPHVIVIITYVTIRQA